MADYSSNYGDSGNPGGEGSEEAEHKSKTASKDESEESEQTALLPKALMAGKDFKPGEEIVLKVVHVYEDEFEVEYASEPSKDEDEKKPMNTMSKSDENLQRMAMSEG